MNIREQLIIENKNIIYLKFILDVLALVAIFLSTEVLSYFVTDSSVRQLTFQFVGFSFLVIAWVMVPISGMAFYYDRRYLTREHDWTPSTFYYTLAFPSIIGGVIAYIYLDNRRRKTR